MELKSVIIFLQYLRTFIFGNKQPKNKVPIPPKKTILNVKSFNTWLCDPNNNDVYANKGIFLNLDKFSESHITDYIKSKYNINWEDSNITYDDIITFYYKVRQDWFNKLDNNIIRSHK